MNKLLALVFGAFLTIFATNVLASDLVSAAAGTYKLYENGTFICSGQFVESNDITDKFLTAAHCVSTNGKVNTSSKYSVRKQVLDDRLDVVYEEVFALELDKVYIALDTATLKVKRPELADFNIVEVASVEEANTVQIGTKVVAIGYPLGEEITITEGVFSAKRKSPFPEMTSLFNRVTSSIGGGSSGGGLYAEFNGEWKLIGTATGGRGDVGYINIFSLPESIHRAIGPKAE